MFPKYTKNTIVEIINAEVEKPFPFPSSFLDLDKPIPPKIQPKSGIKKRTYKTRYCHPVRFFLIIWVFRSNLFYQRAAMYTHKGVIVDFFSAVFTKHKFSPFRSLVSL